MYYYCIKYDLEFVFFSSLRSFVNLGFIFVKLVFILFFFFAPTFVLEIRGHPRGRFLKRFYFVCIPLGVNNVNIIMMYCILITIVRQTFFFFLLLFLFLKYLLYCSLQTLSKYRMYIYHFGFNRCVDYKTSWPLEFMTS